MVISSLRRLLSLRRSFVCQSMLAVLFIAAGSVSAGAQEQYAPEQYQTPLHVRAIDGEARLSRDGETDPLPLGMPLIEGDIVSTEGGRIEMQAADGSVVDLDLYSALEIVADHSFRLREGRVALLVSAAARSAGSRYHLETPDGQVVTSGAGEYQVATAGSSQEASTRFAQWIDERRHERAASAASNGYLPNELSPYANTFDRYGQWSVEPGYGYVWAPSVEATWQPFYVGYWSAVGRYGWTWISGDPWGWPTHHYGRWHHLRNRWVWSSGRQWSPAWVTWGASGHYVSWSPVGVGVAWNTRRGPYQTDRTMGRVVVPHDYFQSKRSPVARFAVPPHQIDQRAGFVQQSQPPVAPPVARVAPAFGLPPAPSPRDRRYLADARARTRAPRSSEESGVAASRYGRPPESYAGAPPSPATAADQTRQRPPAYQPGGSGGYTGAVGRRDLRFDRANRSPAPPSVPPEGWRGMQPGARGAAPREEVPERRPSNTGGIAPHGTAMRRGGADSGRDIPARPQPVPRSSGAGATGSGASDPNPGGGHGRAVRRPGR